MLSLLLIILFFVIKPFSYYSDLPYPIYKDYNTKYTLYDISNPKIYIDKPYRSRSRIIDTRFIPNTTYQDYKRSQRPKIPGRARGSRSYRTSREIQNFQRPYDLNIEPEYFKNTIIKRSPFNDISESYSLVNYHRFLRECQSDCLKKCLHECRVECHSNKMKDCIKKKRFKKFRVRYIPIEEYPGRKFKI